MLFTQANYIQNVVYIYLDVYTDTHVKGMYMYVCIPFSPSISLPVSPSSSLHFTTGNMPAVEDPARVHVSSSGAA